MQYLLGELKVVRDISKREETNPALGALDHGNAPAVQRYEYGQAGDNKERQYNMICVAMPRRRLSLRTACDVVIAAILAEVFQSHNRRSFSKGGTGSTTHGSSTCRASLPLKGELRAMRWTRAGGIFASSPSCVRIIGVVNKPSGHRAAHRSVQSIDQRTRAVQGREWRRSSCGCDCPYSRVYAGSFATA